jgi:hypothetical protein
MMRTVHLSERRQAMIISLEFMTAQIHEGYDTLSMVVHTRSSAAFITCGKAPIYLTIFMVLSPRPLTPTQVVSSKEL